MEIRVITADFAVAEQITASSLAQIAESGFKSVINDCPADELREMARTLGLEYAYLPEPRARITAVEVDRFRSLLQSLPKPILAFCATGRRSSELYRLATLPPD